MHSWCQVLLLAQSPNRHTRDEKQVLVGWYLLSFGSDAEDDQNAPSMIAIHVCIA
jgi:hypothetical protein